MFCFRVYSTYESVNFARENVNFTFRNVHSYMIQAHIKMFSSHMTLFYFHVKFLWRGFHMREANFMWLNVLHLCFHEWVNNHEIMWYFSHVKKSQWLIYTSSSHVTHILIFNNLSFTWTRSCKRGSCGLGGRSARLRTLGVPLKFVRLLLIFWSLVTWRNRALHRQLKHCCFKTS